MFRVLVEKEIREIIGSTKFAVSFGVCAVIVLLAFFSGASNYKAMRTEYEASLSDNVAQLKGITDWSRVGVYQVFLPPDPVSVLVSGVSNDIGQEIVVAARGELRAFYSRYGQEPVLAVLRFLDLEFVFGVVLSLFAILLCFDAIAGEKESGTLRLTFANAVPRHTYLLSKIVGSFLAVNVPLLLIIALGGLVLVVLGIPLRAEDWGRLALILVIGLIYETCFLSVAVLISSATRRASSSLLILLVIWILAVQLVPRTATLVAGGMIDVPSSEQNSVQKLKMRSQLFDERMEKMAKFKPTVDDPDAAIKEFQQYREKLEDESDAQLQVLVDRLNEERANRERIRENVSFTLARISPAAAFTLAAAALAGTDLELPERFREQATRYREEYTGFIKKKTGVSPGNFISTNDPKDIKPPIDPNELPTFQFSPAPLDRALVSALPNVGLMLVYSLLAFAGAFAVFNRYDLR